MSDDLRQIKDEVIQRFLQNLAAFRYKPEWTFKAKPAWDFGMRGRCSVELLIAAAVPHRDTMEIAPFMSKHVVDEHLLMSMTKPPDFCRYMRHLIQAMEIHEMNEWIRYEGILVFDPHRDPSRVDYTKEDAF